MESAILSNLVLYNNILYIGDEPKACISVIEKFNSLLVEIEHKYISWFNRRAVRNRPAAHDRLRYHINYHFEGGVAVFKFKNEEELPYSIRKECLNACKNLAVEQLVFA